MSFVFFLTDMVLGFAPEPTDAEFWDQHNLNESNTESADTLDNNQKMSVYENRDQLYLTMLDNFDDCYRRIERRKNHK